VAPESGRATLLMERFIHYNVILLWLAASIFLPYPISGMEAPPPPLLFSSLLAVPYPTSGMESRVQ
jgi:hypothetical protein